MDSGRISSLGGNARSSRAIIMLLVLGFVAILAAAAAAFWAQRQNSADARLVTHTLAVEASLAAYSSANERMETARRGLLLTGDGNFTRIMEEAEERAHAQKRELDRLVADNPSQQRRAARLETLLDAYGQHYRRMSHAVGGEKRTMIADFNDDPGVRYVRQARAVLDEMLAEELQLLRAREARQAQTQFLFNAILIVAGFLIIGVAAATLVLIRNNLAELRRSRLALRSLNEDLEDMVEARTAELQRANAEIQRFAYIVSHDLRSPLVNVMGFTAELEAARKTITDYIAKGDAEGWHPPDQATRTAVEEDLPESIGFIRSSTQKMDRLINAILKLSRQGRRTLAPETLHLTAMVEGIAESLGHRIQETGTTLKVDPLPTLINDRLAVEQVLSNLIENALKYLKPGRAGIIIVTGRVEFGRVLIEVSDNGRGIDPRDHDRIFDLFRRSGMQDQPGEGIGLAHARALAYRLGGTIEVQSALDEGSTFRLTLPMEWHGGEQNA